LTDGELKEEYLSDRKGRVSDISLLELRVFEQIHLQGSLFFLKQETKGYLWLKHGEHVSHASASNPSVRFRSSGFIILPGVLAITVMIMLDS